jgi:hypothetical protein
MKSICIVLIGSFLAMVAPVRAADPAPTTRPSLEDDNRELRAELRAKDRQLKVLSDQLRKTEEELAQLKLKQRLATLQPAVPMVPQVQPFSLAPSAPAMPRGSVPQQFNGSTFYLVPLAENALGSGALKMKAIEVQDSTPPAITVEPIGTIDDRRGATRNLIHGK